MAVQGITYSYEDISLVVMGMKINAEAISYDDTEDDPEAVYGAGSRIPIGMGLGQAQLVDITLDMLESEYQTFAAPAKARRTTPKAYWPFPIVVSYADKVQDGFFIGSELNALHIDTIDKCKVVSISKPNRRGDKTLVRSLKLKGLTVT